MNKLTMKVLLGIGLFFVFNARVVSSLANYTKRATSGEVAEFMESLNSFRRKIATSYEIANMNKLRYSLELEEIASTMKSCNEVRDSPNVVPYLPPNAEAWEQVEKWNLPGAAKLIENRDARTLIRFGFMVLLVQQLMHPLQTVIGCSEFETSCFNDFDAEAQERYNIDRIEYAIVCLVGPEKDGSESVVEKGAAGSSCASGIAIDGLCETKSENINFNEQFGIGQQSAFDSHCTTAARTFALFMVSCFFFFLHD